MSEWSGRGPKRHHLGSESHSRSLLRLTMAGESEIMATGCQGEPFLFPNDLCFGPEGALYMTDSGIRHEDWARGWKIRDDYMDAPIYGRVYRVEPNSREVRKLDSGIRFTNGIAFGPDNNLYVNETLTGMVYRYAWRGDGRVGPRECFGNSVPDRSQG